MSGHVVVVPVILPVPAIMPALTTIASSAAAGVALGASSILIAASVRTLIQRRIEAAQKRIAAANSYAGHWAAIQQEQVRQMALLRESEVALEAAEKRLAASELSGIRRKFIEAGAGPSPFRRRYLGLGRKKESRAEIHALLQGIAESIAAIPAQVHNAAASPFLNLREQAARVLARFEAGESISEKEAVSFKAMVSATVTSFLKEVALERKLAQELQQRAEMMFNEILFYQELARDKMQDQFNSLDVLRDQLLALFDSKEFTLDRVEILDKRFKTVKEEIDRKVLQSAYRQGLSESVTRNLSDMGYQCIVPFPEDEEGMINAVMHIPGGERVQVALHPNNQIAFQIQHERYAESGDLSKEELAHLRAQEKRWCQDLKELIRRLIAEGFEYNISFEKLIPDSAIKVVVVETPEEIEEKVPAAETKHLTKEQP